MDGQSKHKIQTLEDMLRACVIDFGGNWDVYLPLAEFSYNNNYHSSIRCALFETLYGSKYRSPILWAEIRENHLIGSEMVQEIIEKLVLIKDKLKAARDREKIYVGNMRKHLKWKLYWTDKNMYVHLERTKVYKTLRFVEEPIKIIDHEVKSLKPSRILIVKVCWNSMQGYGDL
nr:reverse transcriptase domain-containing protein [Tanacetum cinerariifolium]